MINCVVRIETAAHMPSDFDTAAYSYYRWRERKLLSEANLHTRNLISDYFFSSLNFAFGVWVVLVHRWWDLILFFNNMYQCILPSPRLSAHSLSSIFHFFRCFAMNWCGIRSEVECEACTRVSMKYGSTTLSRWGSTSETKRNSCARVY